MVVQSQPKCLTQNDYFALMDCTNFQQKRDTKNKRNEKWGVRYKRSKPWKERNITYRQSSVKIKLSNFTLYFVSS